MVLINSKRYLTGLDEEQYLHNGNLVNKSCGSAKNLYPQTLHSTLPMLSNNLRLLIPIIIGSYSNFSLAFSFVI